MGRLHLLTEEDVFESFENGRCPFCGSEDFSVVIICPFYGGYTTGCEGCFDGACAYCAPEDREIDQDVYMCWDCHKGYNFRKKCVVTDQFIHYLGPGNAFRQNIEKLKEDSY